MPSPAPKLSRRRLVNGIGASVGVLVLGNRQSAGQSAVAFDGVLIRASQPAGPLIRVRRGERIAARLANDLAEPLALHWHGLRVPAAMDGRQRALAPVPPGASFDYSFLPPDAGTFFYRARHPVATGRPLLAGAVIVDEPVPIEVDHDVLAVLATAVTGITINGQTALDIPVRANDRVRLRLINVAPATLLAVRVAGQAARVMAIDGQPAEPFLARDGQVLLGPGNRIDLFFDVKLEVGARSPISIETARGNTAPISLVGLDGPGRPAPRPDPEPLPANPLPQRMDLRNALRVDLTMTEAGLLNRADIPAFTAARGRTVVLAIANKAGAPWTLHLHGHCVRLLDRLDDGWKPFWLDTVVVPPGQTLRLAFVADNVGSWTIGAEMIGAGTMTATWFDVV